MTKSLQLFFLLLISSLFACEDDDLAAPVPAFITINDIVVKSTDPSQGSTSDNIKDAWVYEGSRLLGAFELPATIPIQNTGDVRLQIGGGIFENGLSTDRRIYPFYELYVLDTTLIPEQKLEITPVVEYTDNAIYDSPWSGEDFESGINFNYRSNSDTTLVRTTQPNFVFEGNASGVAYLDASMDLFEAYTPTFSAIPTNGSAVYLEMNYYCSHDITISIYANDQSAQYPVINFKPRSTWNKVYVEFGPVFSTLFAAYNFNIAIGFSKPLGEEGWLYLDNVKLIHF